MPTLTLVLAEAALERVPRELWSEPAVERYAKRRGKAPGAVLLDRSYHHAAMKKLRQAGKRGRPDLVHATLLTALDSPLNREGLLNVYVHTWADYVIAVKSVARLPRNYDRFVGLMEQVFEVGRAPPEGEALLELRKQALADLLAELHPSRIVAFSRLGKPELLGKVAERLAGEAAPLVLVGGFARGTFDNATKRLAHELVSIDPEGLDAPTVVARVIYAYELATGLSERRLARPGTR